MGRQPRRPLEKNIPLVLSDPLPYNGPMLTADRINDIHRLYHGEHWSVRKIARHLHLGRRTLAKYLRSPVPILNVVAGMKK